MTEKRAPYGEGRFERALGELDSLVTRIFSVAQRLALMHDREAHDKLSGEASRYKELLARLKRIRRKQE